MILLFFVVDRPPQTLTTLCWSDASGVYKRQAWALAALAIGLAGLALSGGPTLAILFALGGAGVLAWRPEADDAQAARQRRWALVIVGLAAAAAALALAMHLWHWRLGTAGRDGPAPVPYTHLSLPTKREGST